MNRRMRGGGAQGAGNTLFSHALRVLACGHCGAPLEVPLEGGSVACGYCRNQLHYAARDESADAARVQQTSQISESERFRRLREQDNKPMLPPPNLAHLFQDGALTPQTSAPAMQEWNQARMRLQQSPDYFAEQEKLFFLTKALFGVYAKQKDDRRTRALLESARDALSDASYRQDIHGMLARNAARVGDVQAAGEWLALCAPYSDSLLADTAYRFSYAYVATARGDFAGVMQALGQRPHDIPIHDSADLVCGVLRANALERQGRLADAVQQLAEWMAQPAGGYRVRMVIESNAHFGLCTVSFAQAQQMRGLGAAGPAGAASAGATPAAAAAGGINWLKLVPWLLMPGFFLVKAATATDGTFTDDGMDMRSFWLLMAGGFLIGPVIMVVNAVRTQRRAAHFAAHGVSGHAQILGIRETGLTVNKMPQVELQLRVHAGTMAPYQVSVKKLIGRAELAQFQPGAFIVVQVDRSNPQNVLL